MQNPLTLWSTIGKKSKHIASFCKSSKLVWLAALVLITITTTLAQENLLIDSSFEGNSTPRGREDFVLPDSWGGWWSDDSAYLAPSAGIHTGNFRQAGEQAIEISGNDGRFAAAIYQQIPNIPPGIELEATIQVYLENIPESGAKVRIGIGNDVGTDPNHGSIVWSDWSEQLLTWHTIAVTTNVEGGDIIVFIYATQDNANAVNTVYLDEAMLSVHANDEPTLEPSEEPTPEPTTAPTLEPTIAPTTNVNIQPDGSVVHVVQVGESLIGLSREYEIPIEELASLNNLETDALLIIGQELVIQPPGSVQTPTSEATATIAVTPVTPYLDPQEAPPAPVRSQADGIIPASDIAVSSETVLCVSMYQDVNHNRIQQANESLLAGGVIQVIDDAGGIVQQYTTDGESEPRCFDNLAVGTYTAVASPPDGYGLTSPNQLAITIHAASQLNLAFGADEGIVQLVPAIRDSDGSEITIQTINHQNVNTLTRSPFEQISGLLLMGIAGFVLISGSVIAFWLRGRA